MPYTRTYRYKGKARNVSPRKLVFVYKTRKAAEKGSSILGRSWRKGPVRKKHH